MSASRVLVTGAASGIGAETVSRLRTRGAQVVGLDLQADEAGAILACDVSDQASVDTAAVAARMVSAALDAPARDVATTRQGTVSYAVLRRLPRRLVDRGVMLRIGRHLRSGHYDDSPLAGDLARSLRAPSR